jgi:hypothetical protein
MSKVGAGLGMAWLTWFGSAAGQERPAAERFLMDRTEEIRLARSAAPADVSNAAGVWVLAKDGYVEAATGTNGFVCYVARSTIGRATNASGEANAGFLNPSIRAPHCMNAEAASSIFPWHALTTQLALRGTPATAIDAEVHRALSSGELRPPRGFAIAYMWSEGQHLGTNVGNWKPHMMVYVPFLHEAMVGPNELLGDGPQVLDAGSPWSVMVVPVRQFSQAGEGD